jgi:two-component system cell cycle sensor histidine kinase/response regulator CckA
MPVEFPPVDTLATENKIVEPRRKTEQDLRFSEIRYRRLFEAARDGILILNAVTLEIIDVNPFMIELLGYSRTEFLGKQLWELGFFKDKEASQQAFRELQAEGYLRYQDLPLQNKDGTPKEVEFVSNVYDEDSSQVIQCNIRDLTARRTVAERLRQAESQFRTLFQNALDAVLIANDQGRFVDANPAACALLGVPYDEVIGLTVRHFTGEDSRADTWPMWEQFLKEGRLHKAIQLLRPDGTVTDVDFFATSNFLPGRHFSMMHDVTERQKLEAQLRQSQKLESVGILAGGIAHDFNNLLTVITGYTELSLRSLDTTPSLARNLEEIRKAAEQAASLTRQLLAFSRKQVLQPRVLDLNAVIANIGKMLTRLVGEDMALRILPDTELGRVKADPGQIEQVILNLVVNARDSMPDGGEITLETANIYLDAEYARRHDAVQPGWYVMLTVTDTGCGMDEQIQKLIFEPFFTTKEQGKGTGLGLATVYGIVKQSSGNIWVDSKVGVGTTFKIYLPLVDEPVTAADAEIQSLDTFVGTETILLAEDEEMVRNLARQSLTGYGYNVLTAANGAEALLICQNHEGPIHLLLTDVLMPGMSGRDLAEQLVILRPETRVLYTSGHAGTTIAEHGILDGDIAFIGKPFTPDSLALKVREVLGREV